MNKSIPIYQKVIMIVVMLFTVLSFVMPQPTNAITSGGGARATSSSTSSTSSASSSASRASTSSSSSMARSQAMSQARQSQATQASRQAAQAQSASRSANQTMTRSQAMKQSQKAATSRQKQQSMKHANGKTMTRSEAKHQANQAAKHRNMMSRTKSLSAPKGTYKPNTSYDKQFMHTSFYNNWIFYYLMMNSSNDVKKHNVNTQKEMMKKQMKKGESLYTITIDTKKGQRVIAVPKKDYDKVKKGQHVEYHNGQLKVG